MIKMTLYPKTSRFSENEKGYVLTEKLDGSNLGIGRIGGTNLYLSKKLCIYFRRNY